MTREEIVEIATGGDVDAELQESVITLIDISYNAGYNAGMLAASKIHRQTTDMILSSMKDEKSNGKNNFEKLKI